MVGGESSGLPSSLTPGQQPICAINLEKEEDKGLLDFAGACSSSSVQTRHRKMWGWILFYATILFDLFLNLNDIVSNYCFLLSFGLKLYNRFDWPSTFLFLIIVFKYKICPKVIWIILICLKFLFVLNRPTETVDDTGLYFFFISYFYCYFKHINIFCFFILLTKL